MRSDLKTAIVLVRYELQPGKNTVSFNLIRLGKARDTTGTRAKTHSQSYGWYIYETLVKPLLVMSSL